MIVPQLDMQAVPAEKSGSSIDGRINDDNVDLDRRNNGKKLRRARLSCLECRRKKLSCDRNLPCQRCIRSRRAEHCIFEDGPQTGLESRKREHEEVSDQRVKLQSDVSRLQQALSETQAQLRSYDQAQRLNGIPATTRHNLNNSASAITAFSSARTEDIPSETVYYRNHKEAVPANDPYFRSPRLFYSRHFLFRFFSVMPGMWSLISETMDEWIKPLGIHLKKNKAAPAASNSDRRDQVGGCPEELLPSREDMDQLIGFYINHLEHVYRVVHAGTMQKDYLSYWKDDGPRNVPMSMLLLAISSLATSTYGTPCNPGSLTMRYRHMHKKWLHACDEWLAHAGRKRRTLIHHQVATIVYLSKRANGVEKKSWWKLTASLVQDAVMDGLHLEMPAPGSPLVQETRRRLWATIRELDLQNSFDLGLPSLLFSLESGASAPVNLEDVEFDESSKELPPSHPIEKYTSASYICYSARTWQLRVAIAQRLCTSQPAKQLNYEVVLQYTSALMQAVGDVPCWSDQDIAEQDANKSLARAFLLGSLQQALIALHQPFVRESGGQSSLSHTICFDTAREILRTRNGCKGSIFPTTNLLRADVFLAVLMMSSIILLRAEGSEADRPDTFNDSITLLEECLPLMEENLARRAMGGHWDLSTVYAAMMLVKLRLGMESRETAKALMAKRFLGAYYRYFTDPNSQNSGPSQPGPETNALNIDEDRRQIQSCGNEQRVQEWSWLDGDFAGVDFDTFDSNMDIDTSWTNWMDL